MENLLPITADNFGGLRDIVFIPVSEVDSIPDPDPITGEIDLSAITFSGSGWYLFRAIRQTSQLEIDHSESGGLVRYLVKITGKVAKETANRIRAFIDMEYHEFLVGTRDYNNRIHLIGGKDPDGKIRGMKFSQKFGTGRSYPNRNEYEFQFIIQSTYYPTVGNNITGITLIPDPASETAGGGEPVTPPES